MCIYGEPGVGKSVLAGSGEKTLLLLNDADEASAAAEHGSTADQWVIKTLQDLEDAYEYARHEGVRDYKWIWIDNLTLLQEQMMDEVLEKLVEAKPHRSRWVPDMHEYLVVQNQVGTYVRYFKALPVHFGFTAHSMRTEDEDGHVQYIPMLQGGQGGLSQKLCGYMNVVGHYSAIRKEGKSIRSLTVTKRGKFFAKSRWSGLQGTVIDPTIPKLMHSISTKFPALGAPPERRIAAKVPASRVPKKTGTTTRRTA